MALKDDMWVRRFVVSDPVRHKKGFTLYKVTSVVFPKKHPEAVTKIVVWKRYNDFKKLHKDLKLKYQKLQLPDKFPPFVKAKFFKRFEDDVIEERRGAALVLLEFVAHHPSLFTSDVFVKFFQCGYSVNSTTGTIERIEPCLNGIVQPFPVDSSWSPTFTKRDNLDSIPVISSEDDVTSFTTDTDSAISSPLPSSVDFCWPSADTESVDQILKCRLTGDKNENDVQDSLKLGVKGGKLAACVTTCVSKTGKSDINLPKVRMKELPLSALWKSIDDLQYFKVLGVYTKVMLVIDTRDDSLHIAKALQKTPCPIFKKQSTVFPRQIPYMVELHGIFETSTAIYLVIQNISSGRLWDYVTPYFPNSLPKTSSDQHEDPLKDMKDSDDEIDDRTGRKSSSTSNCSISTNLTATMNRSHSSFSSSDNENSYLELIRDYTSGDRANLRRFSPKKNEIGNSLSTDNIPAENLQEKINYSKSEGNLNVCDDDLVTQLSSDVSLLNLVTERLENDRTSSDLVEKQKRLEEHGELSSLSDNSGVESKIKNSETVINLSTTNIDGSANIPDVQVDNIVENVRKLLNSVDKALTECDNLASRLDTCVDADIDSLITNAEYLCSERDSVYENVQRSVTSINSSNKLNIKNNILLRTENSNTSTPDSKISRSPAHSLCQYDTSKLHPPSLYSRASSPVSSVSTDGEAQWWKQEIEGNGLKEETVKKWAAQLLVAINALHELGIICRDLNPDNILVHEGNIRLTYFCQFVGVEPPVDYKAVKRLYCAPEVSSIFPITESADWWSYGAILYELITGQSLISCHPGGFHSHTILYVHETVSPEAQSLLRGLLQFNPSERLCSSVAGVDEIKFHPFFSGVDWRKVLQDS